MLGVTSVNRCEACEAVHGRWAAAAGLRLDAFTADEAAAYAFGQDLAVSGPRDVQPPAGMGRRHQRELVAASILIELANLAGNRFLAPETVTNRLQVGDVRTARLLDAGMRAADWAGLRHARARIVGGARGETLEIGIGTGSNLAVYAPDVAVHGIDLSRSALLVAAERAAGIGRVATLREGDAARLPFPDESFDTVVGTFVLCSVGEVSQTLREARRVLRPGGTIRLLEHARSSDRTLAGIQDRMAPAWARMTGGCRLNHDVGRAVSDAGLAVVEERRHGRGLLVEIMAA